VASANGNGKWPPCASLSVPSHEAPLPRRPRFIQSRQSTQYESPRPPSPSSHLLHSPACLACCCHCQSSACLGADADATPLPSLPPALDSLQSTHHTQHLFNPPTRQPASDRRRPLSLFSTLDRFSLAATLVIVSWKTHASAIRKTPLASSRH
jgi:hypothetical protein